jgi:hypothetical protein
MSDAPEMRKVLARDVVPYEWALWCSIEDGEPFANAIESVKWSDDGQHLWYLLGTHNFYKADPDKELELVPCTQGISGEYQEKLRREHAAMIANRPIPTRECDACAGTGRVACSTSAVPK